MPTTTTNFGFSLPAPGGDKNTWGALLNANWGLVDAQMLSRLGGTVTGTVVLDTSAKVHMKNLANAASAVMEQDADRAFILGSATLDDQRLNGTWQVNSRINFLNVGDDDTGIFGSNDAADNTSLASAISFNSGRLEIGEFNGWDQQNFEGEWTARKDWVFEGDIDLTNASAGLTVAGLTLSKNVTVNTGGVLKVNSLDATTTGSAANVFWDAGTKTLIKSTSKGAYKVNRRKFENPLAAVMQLAPIMYESTLPADKDKRLAGFILEEVTKVLPHAENGPSDYDVRAVVALLAAGLQQLTNEVREGRRHARATQ